MDTTFAFTPAAFSVASRSVVLFGYPGTEKPT
jgi:hypothetical protein